jgi:ribosome-associated heat shock protein Hsp15
MVLPDRNVGRAADDGQRLDQWLWFSRIMKTRTSAAQLIQNGKVRVNRARILKPSHTVKHGDVLTITIGSKIRVVRVLRSGQRRGPPLEARLLYQLLNERAGSGPVT